MAQIEQYNLGYAEYSANPNLSPEMLKSQHPVWRSGYRKAQADNAKSQQLMIPTKLYDVNRTVRKYVPTWNDIRSATLYPRYRKLHSEKLRPVLYLLINSVEAMKDELKSYAEVRKAVDVKFEIILQYAYDNGILTQYELSKYDYKPK